MNREIKFRAWDKENNCFWKNTCEAYKNNLQELIINLNGRLGIRTMHELIDESMFPKRFELTQYTGLKDKNVTEIFEGDICEDRHGKFIVKWDSECARFLGYYLTTERETKICYVDQCNKNKLSVVEVIGNIYENKNLLEGEKENE